MSAHQEQHHHDVGMPRLSGRSHLYGNSLVAAVGDTIYSIRWALAPMYVMLWLTMCGYLAFFLTDLWEFFFKPSGHILPQLATHNDTDWLMFILGQIDITMIANLVVMTTIGGYMTFVKDFKGISAHSRLKWMSHLDGNTLKIKMCMSLAGVSGVHLLRTFIDISNKATIPWMAITFQIIIHCVFLVSMLLFTWNTNLMHGGGHASEEH